MQDLSSLHLSTGRRVWLLPGILLLVACSSATPRREPLGERFPAVRGDALDGASLELPGDLGGEPSILLIGYLMEAQFDIDRWLLGLLQLETPVRLLEVPTIDGMVPGLIAGTIDNGMRSGIPPEEWAEVVTLYGDDADRVVALTGDAGGRNARVLLLDGDGQIAWFADRGWSAKLLIALDARARELVGAAAKTTSTHECLMTDRSELLFDFSAPETVQRFAAVDDRVMGGVSQSAMRASSGIAAFEGELSLEQNGGFASVRSAPASVDLSTSEGIALHVRGDGRTYKLRMRTDAGFDGVSYQASFATTPGAWTTVHLPFEAFQPTYRGQVRFDAAPLDPAKVMSFGLLVADEQVGAFRLEIRWIRAFCQR
jgi:monofunctional biosynthetic peptidoglycan transglycosylase